MRPAGSQGRRVLVLGGTSEIALAIVRALQKRESREVVLAGRDEPALDAAAEGLRVAGCPRVVTTLVDALAPATHAGAVDAAFDALGGADIVILAVGVLGERGGMPDDLPGAAAVLQTNVVGAGSLLLHALSRLREDGGGQVIVLSSAAAGRPRRANAVYGASKAGLDSLAQSLGDDLHDRGVRILVVRPGFVHTRMTAGLRPAPLATTPGAVATVTVEAMERGARTVWAPRALQAVMMAMAMVPRRLFKRIRQ